MNPRVPIAIAVLGLLVSAIALWQLQRDPPIAPAPEPQTAANRNDAPATAASPATAAPPTSAELPVASQPARIPVPSTAMTTHPQGLRARVVDEAAQPLPGLAVHLAESASNEPFAVSLLQPQGHAYTPLASSETAADGSLAIGLPIAQDRVYELYVVSPRHATARLGGLRLLPGEWHDLGVITMVQGATLRGRVTVAGRDDLPVPGATITVEIGSAFADAALRGLPDTPPGLLTVAGPDGSYELRHVPSRGAVQVAATAPGFARVLRSDVQLSRDGPTSVDFALPPGLTLGGTVVDANGRPVAQARIEAWPQKAAGGALLGRSDAFGAFVVAGLVDGPYRVKVIARGHETWQQGSVPAGKTDLHCQLVPRSLVRVKATTSSGQVLRVYRLGLRRWFRDHPGRVGAVHDVPDVQARLDGFTDHAELPDVPAGLFVCEVAADGYAMSRSSPFEIGKDGPSITGDLTIDVLVTTGGGIAGRVVDELGQPIAGAKVTSMIDGAMPDNPLQQMLAGAVPDAVTASEVRTDGEGRFRLARLAFGDYQLLVEHAEACRTTVRGVRVTSEGLQDLPLVTMARGAQVTGRVVQRQGTFGQAKVVLTAVGGDAGRDGLRIETATDGSGTFTIPRRVPPGNYELRAAVVGTSEPEAQVFQQLLQMQRSSITFTVAPGQTLVQRDIELSNAR